MAMNGMKAMKKRDRSMKARNAAKAKKGNELTKKTDCHEGEREHPLEVMVRVPDWTAQ